jgi:hypothetical protein
MGMNNPLLKYAGVKKDPAELVKKDMDSLNLDSMDEEMVANSIPIS